MSELSSEADQHRAFVSHGVRSLPAEVRSWLPETVLTEAWTTQLNAMLARITDDDGASASRERHPVAGATVADYRARVLANEAYPAALARITFPGPLADTPLA